MLELSQLIAPSSGHYAELDDILVDAAGALCGALVCRFVII
jgi:hypothetical protein